MLTSVVGHIEVCTCVLIFDAIFAIWKTNTMIFMWTTDTLYGNGKLCLEIWGKLALFSNSNVRWVSVEDSIKEMLYLVFITLTYCVWIFLSALCQKSDGGL